MAAIQVDSPNEPAAEAIGLSLSEAAAAKVRTMREQHEAPDSGLRIMVVGGGCSGLTYDMDFEKEVQDGDQVFEQDDIKLFVDPMSFAYLAGTHIDYVETFSFSGFHFQNPNAQKSCGCGSSFTV